jgi:hypothetical protein
MSYYKAAEVSASLLAESPIQVASCELTRPANTTAYSANDVWNDSDTYNPSCFVFQYPPSWANTIVWISQVVVASNNPNFASVVIVMFYRKYPMAIPLDNTSQIAALGYWTERTSFSQFGSSLSMLNIGAATGKIGLLASNTHSPVMLDETAKLYAQLRLGALYTPLPGESVYIRVIANRSLTNVF